MMAGMDSDRPTEPELLVDPGFGEFYRTPDGWLGYDGKPLRGGFAFTQGEPLHDPATMSYDEWQRYLSEHTTVTGDGFTATDPRWPDEFFEVAHPWLPLHPDWNPKG